MKLYRSLILVALIDGIQVSHAASITVDGNLTDWGLHQNGNTSDWAPNFSLGESLHYAVEDQHSPYLNPGWGGQDYDAEALYSFMNSTHLYIALVTGLSPSTPDDPSHNSFGPGDFAIDFGHDGNYEFGIETTGANAGSVYQVSDWRYGLWDKNGNYDPQHPDLSHPTSINTGTKIGQGSLIYTADPFNNMGRWVADNHYVIEAAIPLSVFHGFSGEFDIHWTMNCANDAIAVDPEITIPEPTSLALIMLGLATMAAGARRQSSFVAA